MKKYDIKYKCTQGEMFGEIKTLGRWLDYLYPRGEARTYFKIFTTKDILSYITDTTGLVLEKSEKGKVDGEW